MASGMPVAAVLARIMAVAICLIRKVVQISVCIGSHALVSSKQPHLTQSLTMNTSSSNWSWWWAHFDEHPGIATREEAAYANIKENKATIVGNSGIVQAYLYCVFNDCCLKRGSE